MFAIGTRPTADDIVGLLGGTSDSSRPALVSYFPPRTEGWLELLANGLTFDLRGLAPARPAPVPGVEQAYGLPSDIRRFEFESIVLAPGEHIAAGGRLLPVVRHLAGLAMDLAQQLPLVAICWNPAQSWMEPKYFARLIASWLADGPFPALGLTGVRRGPSGGVESSGLSFFTGQEVFVPYREGERSSDTIKLAARVIDQLVRQGRLDRPEQLRGPDEQQLTVEPTAGGSLVRVVRHA